MRSISKKKTLSVQLRRIEFGTIFSISNCIVNLMAEIFLQCIVELFMLHVFWSVPQANKFKFSETYEIKKYNAIILKECWTFLISLRGVIMLTRNNREQLFEYINKINYSTLGILSAGRNATAGPSSPQPSDCLTQYPGHRTIYLMCNICLCAIWSCNSCTARYL